MYVPKKQRCKMPSCPRPRYLLKVTFSGSLSRICKDRDGNLQLAKSIDRQKHKKFSPYCYYHRKTQTTYVHPRTQKAQVFMQPGKDGNKQ